MFKSLIIITSLLAGHVAFAMPEAGGASITSVLGDGTIYPYEHAVSRIERHQHSGPVRSELEARGVTISYVDEQGQAGSIRTNEYALNRIGFTANRPALEFNNIPNNGQVYQNLKDLLIEPEYSCRPHEQTFGLQRAELRVQALYPSQFNLRQTRGLIRRMLQQWGILDDMKTSANIDEIIKIQRKWDRLIDLYRPAQARFMSGRGNALDEYTFSKITKLMESDFVLEGQPTLAQAQELENQVDALFSDVNRVESMDVCLSRSPFPELEEPSDDVEVFTRSLNDDNRNAEPQTQSESFGRDTGSAANER